jgi:hypothetical protein
VDFVAPPMGYKSLGGCFFYIVLYTLPAVTEHPFIMTAIHFFRW